MKSFTPRETVSELDAYIIGQGDAKRAVAIALRNRWRRQQLPKELREEIVPKNIIMIGPTGVGKNEIARRLAKLASAPFIKVEASKFTEVGYVGKDVEGIIRELTELSVKMVSEEEQERVRVRAQEVAEEKILDILAQLSKKQTTSSLEPPSREKLRTLFREGKFDDELIELDVQASAMPMIEVMTPGGMEEMGMNLKEMLGNMMPKQNKRRKIKVKDAVKMLVQEEASKMIDMEEVKTKAVKQTEESGIVFLDEIDKIAGRESSGRGPDVSREGVQRDILPIVEGSTVSTKYGMVRTDHILFIAAGAFHVSKPSDLIPELQGRFPIRVELNSLTKDDLLRILKEPKNSLTHQYVELMKTEGVELDFKEDGMEAMANFAAIVNDRMENIGARRLHTIMEKVLDEISFKAPEMSKQKVVIDAGYVQERVSDVAKDVDLSRYIL